MKKTWIKVKRGLLEPKHRKRLGARIWLYLYILDIADWDTGTITGWTDGHHAKKIGMPARTVQDQRQRLAEDGYISSAQTFQSLVITIHNWTNPRHYDGETINDQGTEILHGNKSSVPHGNKSSVPIQSESSVPLHTVHIKSHIKDSQLKTASRKRDARLDHPAVIAYRETAHLTAPAAVRDDLCEVEDADKWRGIVKDWIGKGWNPRNISGMLEVYRNGWRKNGSGRENTNATMMDIARKYGKEKA